MNENEMSEIRTRIRSLWKAFDPTPEQREVWENSLRPLAFEAVRAGLDAHYRTAGSYKMPMLSKVLELAKACGNSESVTRQVGTRQNDDNAAMQRIQAEDAVILDRLFNTVPDRLREAWDCAKDRLSNRGLNEMSFWGKKPFDPDPRTWNRFRRSAVHYELFGVLVLSGGAS